MHHVLNPDDADSFGVDGTNGRDQFMAFGVGEPAGNFIEQQRARTGGECPRQFQPLAVEQRQASRQPIGLCFKSGECQRPTAERYCFRLRKAAAEQSRNREIFEHREMIEW